MPDSDQDNKPEKQHKPRKISGIAIFVGLLVLLAVVNYRPPVPTIACDENTLATQPDVIMLGAWWCTYCYQARKYFTDNDIKYCEYDIEYSEKGKSMIESLPGAGIPVIYIGEDLIIGFDQQAVEQALGQLDAP